MRASACSCATRAHARSLKRRLGGATAHHPATRGGLQAPGSELQAPGSRLQAPGSTTYGTSRRHHPVLLGRAPQALGSWPCHALRTSRSATEGPMGGCGAALGPGQRRRLCGVPPPGPRLRVQQHALASPQTQAQYLDLGDGLTKCCSLQGCFRCGTGSTVPVTSIHGTSVSHESDILCSTPLYTYFSDLFKPPVNLLSVLYRKDKQINFVFSLSLSRLHDRH